MLATRVEKDKLYSWTTISCLSFLISEQAEKYFDIEIHEKHGGQCPGDPNTFPIIDRFRIQRVTGRIQWYNIEMELKPYKAVLKWRKIKEK